MSDRQPGADGLDADAGDEREDAESSDAAPSPGTLVAAGLLGAALGAGIGLLLSRGTADGPAALDRTRRAAARARRDVARDTARAVTNVGRATRRGGAGVADDAGEALAAAARSLARTREELRERVERELREVRRLVRRGRRRGWLG
jgi:hypothetical protein